MRVLYVITMLFLSAVITANAQNTSTSPLELKGAAKKQFNDSTLLNAGATAAQIQQYNAAKTLANNKANQVRKDSTLSFEQREQQLQQITAEKNNSYKTILGAAVYKTYNKFKNKPIAAQLAEINRPTEQKMINDCLDSVNATASQKQEYFNIKRLYKDSVKAVLSNPSLTDVQKKQSVKALNRRKDQQYVQVLGQVRFNRHLLAKQRRRLADSNN